MAYKVAPDAQEAIATARFVRMSPTKARAVIDLIRGRHVHDARRVLKFSERGAAAPVAKVLESAIANAVNNRALPDDELIVMRAWADEGPTLRRFRPRALGRATRIRKRTCHIAVVVGRPDDALFGGLGTATVDQTKRRVRKDTAGEESSAKDAAKGTAAAATDAGTSKTAPKTSRRKKTTSKKTTAKKTTAKKTTAKKTTRRKKKEGDA